MGTIVWANELQVGDLYRIYSTLLNDRAGGAQVYRVTGRRTVRFVETYEVLETVNLANPALHGEMGLRIDIRVERLDGPYSRYEIERHLACMEPGAQLNIVYEGAEWYWA